MTDLTLEMLRRARALLEAESPMTPIGCSTWELDAHVVRQEIDWYLKVVDAADADLPPDPYEGMTPTMEAVYWRRVADEALKRLDQSEGRKITSKESDFDEGIVTLAAILSFPLWGPVLFLAWAVGRLARLTMKRRGR